MVEEVAIGKECAYQSGRNTHLVLIADWEIISVHIKRNRRILTISNIDIFICIKRTLYMNVYITLAERYSLQDRLLKSSRTTVHLRIEPCPVVQLLLKR